MATTSAAMSDAIERDLVAADITAGYDQAQLDWLNSKKLCDICENLFKYWYARDNWETERPDHRHDTLSSLQASAEDGCPVCEMFLNSFMNEAQDKLVSPSEAQLDDQNEQDQDPSTPVGAPFECTDSDASWELARRWLRSCAGSHRWCQEAIMERLLPNRLVDIGPEGHPRLCLAAELPTDTQYLTLSHCWGRKSFTTLRSENIDAFLSKIPDDALSKTFRHAIKATRILGFKYLWIDSLCIVQDDAEDWKQQAAVMGNIYANSSLNLAAIDASDGDGGLCFHRTYRKVSCWKLNLYDEHDGQVSKTWNCHLFEDNNPELRNYDILSTRAWACQETLLAPRSLSFGQQELTWECRQARCSETLPLGIEKGTMSDPGCLSGEFNDLTVESLIVVWASVVANYSSRRLTFANDKLVAIAGVARFLQQRYGSRYIAGLWKEDLVKQLGWHAVISTNPTSSDHANPKNEVKAPSWPWTAINNQVFFSWEMIFGGTYHELVSVEEVHVTPANSFDEVNGGTLMLRCQYLGIGGATRDENLIDFGVTISSREITSSFVYPDCEPGLFDSQVHYLPILLSSNFNRRGDFELRSLVLKPSERGNYVRIGCFEVWGDESITLFLSELIGRHVNIDEPKHDDLLSRREGDGNTWHMITIV